MIIAIAIVVYHVVKLFIDQESLDIVDVLFNQVSDILADISRALDLNFT